MGKKRDALKVEPLVECVVDAILEKKGKNVTSLAIGKLPNAVCNYFIICHADSTTQVNAIAENVEFRTKNLDSKVWKTAGYDNCFWVILDFVDVVVHVFQTEMRSFYRLEELWADAETKVYTDEPAIPVEKTKAKPKKLLK